MIGDFALHATPRTALEAGRAARLAERAAALLWPRARLVCDARSIYGAEW